MKDNFFIKKFNFLLIFDNFILIDSNFLMSTFSSAIKSNYTISNFAACSSLNLNELILFIKMKILNASVNIDVSEMLDSNNRI